MYFLKRSLSFVRFRVVGKFHFSQQAFENALLRNAFRDFSELSITDDESFGWVSLENCLEQPLLSEIMTEPYLCLMMRIDRRRVSKTLLAAHLSIEERAALAASGKKKLSQNERRELKTSVKQMLMEKATPSSALYRALWNFRTATCLLFSTAKNVQHYFCKLFETTFEHELMPLTPWSMAGEWEQRQNCEVLKDLQPSSFRV